MSRVSACLAALIMRRPSRAVMARGFSHRTWRPALAAAVLTGAWRALGRATLTAWRSRSFAALRSFR